MTVDPRLHPVVAAEPYPLLFATNSGAHVLPPKKVVGLDARDETVEDSIVIEGLEINTHPRPLRLKDALPAVKF